jgi:murein DD-endopeptidase MepM/ murein hydrolase activator NlpD
MRQPYFIVVLAHSFHGRLRRIHVPHQVLWAALVLLAVVSVTALGILSSYVRMTWKVANYNSLRKEVDTLRTRYQALQRESNEKSVQLASLQVLANEVSIAYGIKKKLEGPPSIAAEGKLLPTFKESLLEYDTLKTASLSPFKSSYARQWLTDVRPSLWPVPGRLMSTFGGRSDPFSGAGAFHTGIDLSATSGTPVHAAADGIISFASWSGGFGKLVIVDHGNGMQTFYAHLSSFSVLPGQEIRLGQVVGRSGGTGHATGPHLHYEVHVGGTPVNPYPYLKRALLQTTTAVQKDLPF